MHIVLLIFAAFIAGAINSVAGGGTLLTFPTLLAMGMPSVIANGTSTVSLVPGSISSFVKYIDEIKAHKPDLIKLGIPSVFGGYIGARIVVHMTSSEFSHLVPFLILGATALFIVQEPVQRSVARKMESQGLSPKIPGPLAWVGVMVFQFFVAVYGGLFGAGMGILMLAALGILGIKGIHKMNALKNFAAICINGVASITFIAANKVDWSAALIMTIGAVAGGYLGAGLAQKVGEKGVRVSVVVIGLLIGIKTLAFPMH